jgi:hypothetical protein
MKINIILDFNNHNLIKLFNIQEKYHNLLGLNQKVENRKEKNVN